MAMQVREVMNVVVMTIPAGESALEAALRMRRSGIHHLPVVGDRGQVEGIVTDRDLRSLLFAALAGSRAEEVVDVEKTLRERPVRDVMSAPAVTVRPQESLATTVRLMAERKIGSILVVDDNGLIGIVTETDLIALLSQRGLFSRAAVDSVILPAA
jgi:acetoin utilization protein AcuB